MGLPLQAEAELQISRRIAAEIGDHATRINLANQFIRCAVMRGEFGRAREFVDECLRAVDAGGHGPGFRADALGAAAMLLLIEGRPAEAMAELRRIEAIVAETGRPMAGDWVALLAAAWLQRGRPDHAKAVLEQCAEAARHRGTAFVRVRLAQGDDQALDAALAELARCWPADDAIMGLRRRVLAARLGRASAPDIGRLIETLQARGLRPLLRSAHLASARYAGDAGDHAAAAAHARDALALAAMVDPWVDEAASVWVDAAAALRRAGAAGEAAAALAEGRRWVERTAATLEGDERRDWLEGNPLHRALAAPAGAPPG
jgi:tetratricopeptide (TPR) repeat protein